jgi:hypothetical protein
MSVAQSATSAEYSMAVLAKTKNVQEQQAAGLIALVESAGAAAQAPRAEGVGQFFSVYA